MNYKLILRPELVEDAHEAFLWYEEAATGLGHEFLRSYFIALADLERQPLNYRKVYQDFRRILLGRFPYTLYFRIERKSVMVFLLIHCARDPVLIRQALRGRKLSAN